MKNRGFRPLTGFLFFYDLEEMCWSGARDTLFPSPYGVFVFLLGGITLMKKEVR